MADTSIDLTELAQDWVPANRVLVLDDLRARASAQAIGIAERLGVPFRRVPLSWNWLAHLAALPPRGSLLGVAAAGRGRAPEPLAPRRLPALPFALPGGSGPGLILSAGSRAAAVALWLKARFGSRIVHCGRPLLHGRGFDLLVIGEHEPPPQWPNVLSVLGVPHRLSPLLLCQAEAAWSERLAHLPRPRFALLAGGPVRGTDMVPALAHTLGLQVAALARRRGGSVLAATGRRTGGEATEALAAGLASTMHVLHRWGEPGADPYAAFLASADMIVVTGDSIATLSEACATAAAVFLALPELGGARQRRLHANLFAAGYARPFADDVSPWSRRPLDEAGRVGTEIVRRFLLDFSRID